MRKIILYSAASIDGYIARTDGSIDWLFNDQDYGYKEFLTAIDTVLMGHKTYEQMLTFGEYEFKNMQSIVFTRKNLPSDDYIHFVNNNIREYVMNLKNSPGKNIWLIGGGEINTLLLEYNLIDEILLFIQPIILGSGIPLFKSSPEKSFTVKDIYKFSSGMVKLELRT